MLEGLAIGTTLITVILTVGSVLHALLRSRKERRLAELRVQMQTELLQKFENAEDALSFLESEAGLQFAASNTLDRSNVHQRMLASLQIGIVAAFVGGSLFLVRGGLSHAEAREVVLFLASVVTAIGLGFVVSSAVGLRLSNRYLRSAGATLRESSAI